MIHICQFSEFSASNLLEHLGSSRAHLYLRIFFVTTLRDEVIVRSLKAFWHCFSFWDWKIFVNKATYAPHRITTRYRCVSMCVHEHKEQEFERHGRITRVERSDRESKYPAGVVCFIFDDSFCANSLLVGSCWYSGFTLVACGLECKGQDQADMYILAVD